MGDTKRTRERKGLDKEKQQLAKDIEAELEREAETEERLAEREDEEFDAALADDE